MNNAEMQITRLIHASACYLDDHKFDAYVALFAEEGAYSIVVQAPELASPMIWMQRTKTELAERFGSAPKHEWRVLQQEQTRLVSVNMLEVKHATADSSSSFVIYNTDEQGRSDCFAVGRYEDRWCMKDQNWFIDDRKVVLKTRLLSSPTALPL